MQLPRLMTVLLMLLLSACGTPKPEAHLDKPAATINPARPSPFDQGPTIVGGLIDLYEGLTHQVHFLRRNGLALYHNPNVDMPRGFAPATERAMMAFVGEIKVLDSIDIVDVSNCKYSRDIEKCIPNDISILEVAPMAEQEVRAGSAIPRAYISGDKVDVTSDLDMDSTATRQELFCSVKKGSNSGRAGSREYITPDSISVTFTKIRRTHNRGFGLFFDFGGIGANDMVSYSENDTIETDKAAASILTSLCIGAAVINSLDAVTVRNVPQHQMKMLFVQQNLVRYGYTGPMDGLIGPKTLSAWNRFAIAARQKNVEVQNLGRYFTMDGDKITSKMPGGPGSDSYNRALSRLASAMLIDLLRYDIWRNGGLA